jgi:hypothetical protein
VKTPEQWAAAVEQWRRQHETDYRKEYVTLAGLFPLKPGANSIGSGASSDIVLPKPAPPVVGTITLGAHRVTFRPASTVDASIKGTRVSGETELHDDEVKGGPDEVEVAPGVAFWVHLSGDRPTIRVRNEHGDVARTFAGFNWFPIDARYPEGVVEFTLDGQTVRLRPMTTRPGRLYFIFRDGTSGAETYGTARFLYADLKSDGTTILDFNEAYNPPCAFNPYTTCPLPLPENRLSVRIPVGERNYVGSHPAAG